MVMKSITRLWCESKYSCLCLLGIKPTRCFHFVLHQPLIEFYQWNFIRIFNTDNMANLTFNLEIFMWAVLGTDIYLIWILNILASTDIGRQRKPVISLPWICYGTNAVTERTIQIYWGKTNSWQADYSSLEPIHQMCSREREAGRKRIE